MTRIFTLLIGLVLVAGYLAGCGGSGGTGIFIPATFFNGDFETPVLPANTWLQPGPTASGWTGEPNWGIANGTGSWTTGGGHTGQQCAYVQASSVGPPGRGTLEQFIDNLIVGRTYRVVYWQARRNGNVGGNTGAPVKLTANGTEIVAPTAPPGDGSWAQITSATFVAGQNSYHFIFEPSIPGGGADTATLIDDVALELIP